MNMNQKKKIIHLPVIILYYIFQSCRSIPCNQRPFRNYTKTPILILTADKRSGYSRTFNDCSVACTLSGDISLWPMADAWLERIPSSSNAQRVKRPTKVCPLQQYVLLSMESEQYYSILKHDNAKSQGWDLISSTSIKSDIPLTYASNRYTFLETPVPFENKTKAAAVFISNCGAKNGRLELVSTLMKLGLPVNSYGKCLNNANVKNSIPAKVSILRNHLFSFAFENSNVHNYVTEKYFQSLAAGSLPVYFGAPNIQDFAPTIDPSRSIIDVNSIKGSIKMKSKLLLKRLMALMKNEREYEEMLRWKTQREILGPLSKILKQSSVGSNCRVCLKVKESIEQGLTSAPPVGRALSSSNKGQGSKQSQNRVSVFVKK